MENWSIARKKIEIQGKGIRIPVDVKEEVAKRFNVPGIESGRLLVHFEDPLETGEFISAFTYQGYFSKTTPYHLKKNERNTFSIFNNGHLFADVHFPTKPKFYSKKTHDGVPMSEIVALGEPGHIRTAVTQKCHYITKGIGCKFCALPYWWDHRKEKTPEQISDCVEEGRKEKVVEHVSLSTGSQASLSKGIDILAKTAGMINRKSGDIPIMVEFEPVGDIKWLELLKNNGVTTVFINMEIFDPNIRKVVMPGKGKIPLAMYEKNWKWALKLFGENQVFTTIIAGLGESDDSIMKGAEFAMMKGVNLSVVPHMPTVGAPFERFSPPTPERMSALYTKIIPLYEKYKLDPFGSMAGCAKGGAFTAIKDVMRFGLTKKTATNDNDEEKRQEQIKMSSDRIIAPIVKDDELKKIGREILKKIAVGKKTGRKEK